MRAVAAGAALVCVACGLAPEDGDPIARVDTLPSGRVVVTNTGASQWTPETAWRLVEDVRLGSPEGGFRRIVSLASDSRQRIYVLDDPHQISVYDSTGTFSHSVGREGRGPGELASASSIAIGPGDTLWVTDQGTSRYTLFAPSGTFVRSYTAPIRGHDILGRVLFDGSFLDWVVGFSGEWERVELHPIRFSPSFERADSLPPLEFTQETTSDGKPQINFSGMITGVVGTSGDTWFAHTREYRIQRRSPAGDTTLVFSLPAVAATIDERDRESVRSLFDGAPQQQLQAILDELPEARPIVNRLLHDGDGHILVLADVDGVPSGSIVDVFEDSGQYLGRMNLPMPVPVYPPPVVAHATQEHLFIVTKDELDVSYVSRLRIVRGNEQRPTP